jgi:hypothetical protein
MPEHPDCLRVPDQLKEVQMDKKKPESAAMRAKSAVEDAFGLPPGDKTAHGRGKPARDPNVPHGSLTAADAEDAPAPKGTGSKAK